MVLCLATQKQRSFLFTAEVVLEVPGGRPGHGQRERDSKWSGRGKRLEEELPDASLLAVTNTMWGRLITDTYNKVRTKADEVRGAHSFSLFLVSSFFRLACCSTQAQLPLQTAAVWRKSFLSRLFWRHTCACFFSENSRAWYGPALPRAVLRESRKGSRPPHVNGLRRGGGWPRDLPPRELCGAQGVGAYAIKEGIGSPLLLFLFPSSCPSSLRCASRCRALFKLSKQPSRRREMSCSLSGQPPAEGEVSLEAWKPSLRQLPMA